jgi:hypothetical protein
MKVLTTMQLLACAKIAEERDYNRQIEWKTLLDKYPPDVRFPVLFNMLHEHAGGKRVAPHVRALIGLPSGNTFQLDCDLDVFNALEDVEVTACEAS